MDVGDDMMDDMESDEGWIADDSEGGGYEPSVMDKALGGAVDLAQSAVGLVTDVASGALDVATSSAKSAIGIAGSLASAAMDAFTPSSP